MKKKVLISMFFALLLCLCTGFFGASFSKESLAIVYASETLEEPESEEVPETEETLTQSEINKLFQKGHVVSPGNHIVDSVLYGRLLDIVTEEAAKIGYKFTGDELYHEMFTKFAVGDKIMNITQIEIQDDLIESLEGLEYLKLDNIRKFVVSSNKLKSVNETVFENMDRLEYISFANNELTSCDLTALQNLKYVNLSSNNLTSIDLSRIVSANIEINLANNMFTDMAKIKLPNRADNIKLNIMANNIVDIPEEYFNVGKNSKKQLAMYVGVQGIKKSGDVSKLNTATNLNVYRFNNSDLRLVVYKITNLIERTEFKTISDADFEKGVNCVPLNFPVGDYIYEFESLVGDEYVPIYDKYDEVNKIYNSQEFKVVPKGVDYVYEYRGKIYNTLTELGKVTGDIKIHLSCEEGGQIYYYNGKEWKETSVIECSGGGSRSLQVKVVKDGYESDVTSIRVETSLNKNIPDFLMFALVFAFALILFVVVIPLVSKKFFKK